MLFASKEHERTNFSRLEVEETGAVSVAEHPVYSTYNELLAVAVDMRPNAPLAFLVLEADPEQHDHLTLVHIPLTGDPEIRDLGLVEGWPFVVERVEQPRRRWPDEPEEDPAVRVTEVRRALRAIEVSLEVGLDGTPWLALVDEQGSLYGGRLDGPPLALLRQGEPDGTFKATKPHAAALARGVTLSAFTETGALFHAGVR